MKTSYRESEWDFPTLYESGEWEPETKAVLDRFLTPGGLFLDIGAWCGPVTLWALELGARVIAVEPDPEARKALYANVTGRPAKVLPVALNWYRGLAVLAADGYFGDSQSRLVTKGDVTEFGRDDPDELVVECWTPRFLLHHIRTTEGRLPDLVKVDIEGGETAVLPALAPLCAVHRIPLLVAWHEPWWPQPVGLEERQSWFAGMQCEGDWDGWGQLLAVPE